MVEWYSFIIGVPAGILLLLAIYAGVRTLIFFSRKYPLLQEIPNEQTLLSIGWASIHPTFFGLSARSNKSCKINFTTHRIIFEINKNLYFSRDKITIPYQEVIKVKKGRALYSESIVITSRKYPKLRLFFMNPSEQDEVLHFLESRVPST